MPGITISVLGAEQVEMMLSAQIPQAVENAAEKAISEAALFLKGEIKESIAGNREEKKSVDTRRFLGSITAASEGLVGEVSTDVPYSIYLEYGTSKIDARAHFGNSASRNSDRIVEYVKDAIEGASLTR